MTLLNRGTSEPEDEEEDEEEEEGGSPLEAFGLVDRDLGGTAGLAEAMQASFNLSTELNST